MTYVRRTRDAQPACIVRRLAYNLLIVADEKRQERFAVRLSPAEAEMVARLANADGVSRSDAVRMCVRAVYAERQPPWAGSVERQALPPAASEGGAFVRRSPWRSPL